jgi:hypothetical protein
MNRIPQLKEIIETEIQPGRHFKIMSAHFSMFAFNKVRNKLQHIELIINPNRFDLNSSFIETAKDYLLKSNPSYAEFARQLTE